MHINETNGATPRIAAEPGARRPAGAARVSDDASPDFATIYRATRGRPSSRVPDTVPASVLADVQRAARLADALAERGQQVRFSTHDVSGRVVAHLCDADGTVQRPVPLTELIPDPRRAA